MAESKRSTERVEVTKWWGGDRYTGTKNALIAQRICKAKWFPRAPVPFPARPGRLAHKFLIVDDVPVVKGVGGGRPQHPYIILTESTDGTWHVDRSISEEERAKRGIPAELPKIWAEISQGGDIEPGKLEGMAFEVGDSAVLHAPGSDEHHARAKVIAGYGLYPMKDHEGVSRKEWGYRVEVAGKTYFAPAWQLRDRTDKPAHLKLVPELAAAADEAEQEKCPHCGAVKE